jgi:adenosylhomocysteine nucleosidase
MTAYTNMTILIAYALKPEASSLIASLSMIPYTHDPDVYRAENIYAVITGLGYERALAACNKAIELIAPDCILNAGSAGSLSDAIHKKNIYHIHDVRSETGEPIHLAQFGVKNIAIRLFTSMKPLLDDTERQKHSSLADCVDMEGYAIALSADKARIPCSIVKIITDAYGDSDSKAIRRSILDLSCVLNDYIVKIILPNIPENTDT